MSDMSCNSDMANKNISCIAWFSAASAEYLDLGITREQKICLYQECLNVAKIHGDMELNILSSINLMELIYKLSTRPSTLEHYIELYKLAQRQRDNNLEMVTSLLLVAEFKGLNDYKNAILYAMNVLSIAKKIGDQKFEKTAYLILMKSNLAECQYKEAIMYGELCLEVANKKGDKLSVTDAYLHLGKTYYLLKEYDDAMLYSRKCLEFVEEIGSRCEDFKMNAYLQLANIYQSLNCQEEVIHFSMKSIELAKKHNDRIVEIKAYLLLFELYFDAKRYNDCLLYSQKLIHASKTAIIRNKEAEMSAYVFQAQTYCLLKEYDDAIISSKKSIDIAINTICEGYLYDKGYLMGLSTKEVAMFGYLVLAESHLNLNEYDDSILCGKKGTDIARKLKNEKMEIKGCLFLGQAYKSLKKYDDSILYLQKCINIAEETGRERYVMQVYNLLGQMYTDVLKDAKCGIFYFKKYIDIAKRNGDLCAEMLACLGLAKSYYWLEECNAAIAHGKKCFDIAVKTGKKQTEMDACLVLGKSYEFLEQFEDAFYFSNKCIEIAKQKRDKIVEANAYLVIGRAKRKLGRYGDAILYNEKSREMSKQIGEESSEMIANYQIGNTYFDKKRFDDVIVHCNESIGIAQTIGDKYYEMKAYRLLGTTYKALDEYDNAILFIRRCASIAVEIKEKSEEAKAYLSLGRVGSTLDQHDDAIRYALTCLDIAKVAGDKNSEMKAFVVIGNACLNLEKYDEAIFNSRKSLKIALKAGEKESQMVAYVTLGDAYLGLEKYSKAIHYSEKCLGMSNETGEKQNEITARACMSLGRAYLHLKSYEDSILYMQKCLGIAKHTGNKILEMQTYVLLGNTYLKLQVYDEAIFFSEKCLDIGKKTKNISSEARTCASRENVCPGLEEGNVGYLGEKSIGFIKKDSKKAQTESLACMVLAESYYSLKKCDEALAYSEKCIEITSQINDKVKIKMEAFLFLSKMYDSMKKYEDSIRFGNQCAELAKKNENKQFERDSCAILRSVYSSFKEKGHYVLYSKKCLQIAKEMGDKEFEMYSYSVLGDAYFSSNLYEDALINFDKCIEMAAQKTDECDVKMNAYLFRGYSYHSLAKFQDAIDNYKLCKDIAKETNDSCKEMKALSGCGEALLSLNQYDDAYSCLTKSFEIAKTLCHNFEINRIKSSLFILYEAVGMEEEALRYINMADIDLIMKTGRLIIDDEEENEESIIGRKIGEYNMRHLYHRSRNEYYQAISCLQEAIVAADSICCSKPCFGINKLNFKIDISDLYMKLGQYDNAMKSYQEGLALAIKYYNKHFQALCHHGIGVIYCKLEQSVNAEKSFKDSIKCFEFMFDHLGEQDRFKIAIVDKHIDAYKMLLKVLVAAEKNEEALLLSDHFRARALKDLLVSNCGMKKDGIGKERLQMADVHSLVTSSKYAILLYSECPGELFAFLIAGNDFEFSVQPLKYCDRCMGRTIEKAFDEIKVREVVKCEDRSLDQVIHNTESNQNLNSEQSELTKLFWRRKEKALQEQCRSTHENRGETSGESGENNLASALEILYHKLLLGVLCHVKQDEVVIIPDGILNKVPFAALRDPETGRYLSQSKRIRLAPSITTLWLLKKFPAGYHYKSDALIIGDPLVGKVMFDGKEKEFPPLENAFCEALAVGSILYVTPLTREKATKQAVIEKLQQGVSFVHIAAHGSLTKCTIALAPSPEIRATKIIPDEEDYMLSMADVQKAQVRAQLVVLSCCHSGRGEIRAEGVVGMCRAFLASGARAVVASLWAINDEATLEFMTRFYLNLRDGKSACTSLQQTMNQMVKITNYSEPKYWAPFFLMGDDVTLKF